MPGSPEADRLRLALGDRYGPDFLVARAQSTESSLKSLTALALAALLILAIGAPLPLRAASAAAPCSFARGNPIAPTSSWVEQFKCYQSTGRHVSVAGSSGFDAGSVSGGVCVVGVATDRVQVAPCGSLSGDTAMTIAFSAIAYVVDDPKADAVSIYVSALLRH